MYLQNLPKKVKFGIGAVVVGIVLVFVFTNIFGNKSILESAALSLAIGIYFLGLNFIFSAADESSSNQMRELSDKERDNRLKNIERIVEQWDLDKEPSRMTIEVKPELIEYVEQEMKETSKLYFNTILDFLKWNTAFAVAAILWFGNYLINTTTIVKAIHLFFATFTLLLFVFSIAWSIVIFYYVSKHINNYWILVSRWRESLVSRATGTVLADESKVSQALIDYHQNLPKEVKSFDTAIIGQWILLCLGLGSFVYFIIFVNL